MLAEWHWGLRGDRTRVMSPLSRNSTVSRCGSAGDFGGVTSNSTRLGTSLVIHRANYDDQCVQGLLVGVLSGGQGRGGLVGARQGCGGLSRRRILCLTILR